MKLSPYIIQEIAPMVIGDSHAPYRTGPALVKLFNKYGAMDIYDDHGLPDIGKRNDHRPSRTQYAIARMTELNGKPELREFLTEVSNSFENKVIAIPALNALLQRDNYSVDNSGTEIKILGGTIDKSKPITNEAHFKDIEDRILDALDKAKVSIIVAMGWFTNERLRDKLLAKQAEGVDVKVVLYDDGINRKHGVDLSLLPHKKVRGDRGGIMHHKFCVIDNQVVITGSYNWSDNAEFRNTENITIEKDPDQATKYSIEFRGLNS